jgi:hypothetical protein
MLRIEAAHYTHEAGGNDALHESEEESLNIQTLPCRNSSCEHADSSPQDHHWAENSTEPEALHRECQWIETRHHPEVE